MMSLCTITEIDITETKEEIFKSICKNRFFTVNNSLCLILLCIIHNLDFLYDMIAN